MCTWEQSGLEVPALNKDVPAWFWFFCCFFFQQPPHIALPQEGHAEGGPAAEPQGDRAGAARGHPPTQRNKQHRAPQSPAELFGSLHFGISLQPTWPAFPKRSETFPIRVGHTTFLNHFSVALPSFGTQLLLVALVCERSASLYSPAGSAEPPAQCCSYTRKLCQLRSSQPRIT